MATLTTPLKSDTWIEAPWQEFIQAAKNPDYEKAKFYYYQNQLRIEMSPIGSDHASDHSIINTAINLYAVSKGIALNGKDNCSYRMTGYQEAQPDLSYYIGDAVNEIPYGTGIVKLEKFVPPTLVVEIANTSLTDDQGRKRLLYEDLGISEYWIIDVQQGKIIAFKMEGQGSYRIHVSQVLEGLELSILEEALRMTRQASHTQVAKWLLERFS